MRRSWIKIPIALSCLFCVSLFQNCGKSTGQVEIVPGVLPVAVPLTSSQIEALSVNCESESPVEVANPEGGCFQVVLGDLETAGLAMEVSDTAVQDLIENAKVYFSAFERGPDVVLVIDQALNLPIPADMSGANFNLYIYIGSGSIGLTQKITEPHNYSFETE